MSLSKLDSESLQHASPSDRAEPASATKSEGVVRGGAGTGHGQASRPVMGKQSARFQRGHRVYLGIPVTVRGQAAQGASFQETGVTLVVHAQGAFITLEPASNRLLPALAPGQDLQLENKRTGEQVSCRVASAEPSEDGRMQIDLAFTQPKPNFWHICFPAGNSQSKANVQAMPGGRPLSSPGPSGAPPARPSAPKTQTPALPEPRDDARITPPPARDLPLPHAALDDPFADIT